jgi:hypothetical protein
MISLPHLPGTGPSARQLAADARRIAARARASINDSRPDVRVPLHDTSTHRAHGRPALTVGGR